ncbi:MAG: CaiB/BaiF CoA transferase family protein [Dehalococcoidia bacterium]
MAQGPLDGIKVLEFSQIVAGPYAGVNLSDLGADVLKIEPPEGDSLRRLGAVVPNESKGFQSLNRGKRSLVLDLADERGQAIVHRLVRDFDVVTVNYRLGVARRLKIDYDSLRALRPDLIYVQITGFGSHGPYATRAGSDLVIQGYSGLMAGEGKVDEFGGPMAISCSAVTDYATGLATAMGVCAALYHRERSGEGQILQTSLLATALALQGGIVMRQPATDRIVRDPMLAEVNSLRAGGASYAELLACRTGNRNITSAFRLYYSGYRAKDGGIVLGALTKANRDAMRRVLSISSENSDSASYNALEPANVAGIAEWQQEIQRILLSRTVGEWLDAFDAVGAPVSPVNFPEELSDDPQVQALGLLADLEHEVTGPQRVVGPLIEMSATPPRAQRASPPLGGHAQEILGTAGFSPSEIERLCAAKVVA